VIDTDTFISDFSSGIFFHNTVDSAVGEENTLELYAPGFFDDGDITFFDIVGDTNPDGTSGDDDATNTRLGDVIVRDVNDLTALALFKSFEFAVIQEGGELILDIGEVDVFIGLFLGAGLPFLFAALTIDAVGRAAGAMIEEVRRQFREIPGLREGKEGVAPDSARCVAISTDASLKEMIIPGALAVVVPLVVGFIDVDALGGLLAGALVTGFALAIFMANAGGAWDNAKKYIEAGNHGGKGSDNHKAAVVGDTVGDPFKDTSGPAMNILLKVMTIVSLVFASAFV